MVVSETPLIIMQIMLTPLLYNIIMLLVCVKYMIMCSLLAAAIPGKHKVQWVVKQLLFAIMLQPLVHMTIWHVSTPI